MLASILQGGHIPPHRDTKTAKSPRAGHVSFRAFGSPGKFQEALCFSKLEARSSQELDTLFTASQGLSADEARSARLFFKRSENIIAAVKALLPLLTTASEQEMDRIASLQEDLTR